MSALPPVGVTKTTSPAIDSTGAAHPWSFITAANSAAESTGWVTAAMDES